MEKIKEEEFIFTEYDGEIIFLLGLGLGLLISVATYYV